LGSIIYLFIYLFGAVHGNTLPNDGRCTCEIKPRISMAKTAFNKRRALSLARWT
jgi:hypothetical protein